MKTKKNQNKVVEIDPKKYMEYLESNPLTSLEIDPDNIYDMNEDQKKFIKNYIQFKSIPLAAELSNIDLDTAKSYFMAYSSQNEIRRINSALCKVQFAQKMMSIEDIGGYLSSLIVDNNVPIADRLKTVDKLKVIKMLIELHVLKKNATDDPSLISEKDIEADIRELSIDTIKRLIYTNNQKNQDEKSELIKELNINNTLSSEEIDYLKTLSVKDLLQLIETDIKGETKDDESNQ